MLEGCRVHDETVGIAGPYCTKLLADAGARVTRYEPPGGDPLRRWGSGGLYEYLNAAKSVAEGPGPDPAATADVYVTDGASNGATDVDVEELRRRNPALVVVTISPFGGEGPWAGRPATEFTLQAAAGSTGGRGRPEQPPLAAGGRLGEWITGTYAGVGALAALRTARRHGRGEHVDVAMLDVMAATMVTYPSVFADFQGWPDLPRRPWTVEVPSIEPTSDGYIVVTTNSAQQFSDFLVLIGRPDLMDDRELALSPSRFARRDEFLSYVHEYTAKRPSEEVLSEAALFRIPSAPVLTGETVPSFEHFAARGVFGRSRSGRHVEPRVPYRIEPGPDAQAPETGADAAAGAAPSNAGDLPLAGIRVLDCTAWWAGPSMTHALACLGADVIKVESARRPDLMRFTGTKPPTTEQWWEWGALFHAVNTNKRGLTLDLTNPEGLGLFERLVETADMVVENYTPRVMDNFGLGWDRLSALNPRLVMVRMPAFGLDGPWRDRTGFAQTMESITGMAWLTGYPDGPPTLVRGACDPVAGMHAVVAALVALDERDRTGRGQFVEVPMVEAALGIAAEQVIEHSATGTVLTRQGNRGPAAPQGLYPCRNADEGPELWVAIAVASDEQWRAFRHLLGDPDWARDDMLDDANGRRSAHDRIDAELSRWTGGQRAEDAVAALVAAGVPAEVVIPSREVARNPQIRHRGLLEPEDHPVTGRSEIPGLPFRLAGVDRWLRRASPTLGQHNDEILEELGVSAADRQRLRDEGVIGETVVGA
jgi:crotonobetainyl-CoA:carnitine CoA-transferase CaiB-like acyl-CoA transferase